MTVLPPVKLQQPTVRPDNTSDPVVHLQTNFSAQITFPLSDLGGSHQLLLRTFPPIIQIRYADTDHIILPAANHVRMCAF